MNTIAKSKDIKIYAERSWEFSFFGSPYHAHREFSAVDIYQNAEFGDIALSPVSGRVFKTLKFDSPSLGKSLPEYLIMIQNGNYLARIMHVEPSVVKGDEINVGDELGRFVTNGYFFFWTNSTMHVEVRDLNDYLRAKGGYELMPTFGKEINREISISELEGIVINASKRNIAVELNKNNVVKIGNSYSLADWTTVIDYGGVLGRFKLGDAVYFNGIKIGNINKTGSYMSTFKTEKLRVFANETEFNGSSFMFGRDIARLLPKKYGEPAFEKGDKLRIKLEGK